jgi:O-antigen ligase
MVWLRRARAAAGFLAVAVLLGLFVAEFFLDGTLDANRVRLLIGLIAALLGLDKVGEALPLTVEFSQGDGGGSRDETNTDESD